MKKKLGSVLLLDDNFSTNFIHKKFIDQANLAEAIFDFQSGINALRYLSDESHPLPDLILVDINMPIMNAWDFLENYKNLDRTKNKDTVIILLTTSLSPKDEEMAATIDQINDIWTKPLSVEKIKSIAEKYFPESI